MAGLLEAPAGDAPALRLDLVEAELDGGEVDGGERGRRLELARALEEGSERVGHGTLECAESLARQSLCRERLVPR